MPKTFGTPCTSNRATLIRSLLAKEKKFTVALYYMPGFPAGPSLVMSELKMSVLPAAPASPIGHL